MNPCSCRSLIDGVMRFTVVIIIIMTGPDSTFMRVYITIG